MFLPKKLITFAKDVHKRQEFSFNIDISSQTIHIPCIYLAFHL